MGARPVRPDRTPDPRWQVPQAEVKAYIRQLAGAYTVVTVVFDPWHSKLMRQDLQNEGLPVEEMWQTGARRNRATTSLYDQVIQLRIHHDRDPVLARHVANATTRASASDGGYYLAKHRAGRPMDGAMAMTNMVYGMLFAAPPTPSVYETRGFLDLWADAGSMDE
jgi:phage terminase large subunit-like protein